MIQDLRFAIRTLLKSPGFTIIAVATLALGIGANTAIFSMTNALLLRPLPIDEPDRVVQVYRESDRGVLSATHAYPSYVDLRDQSDAFTGLAMRSPASVHVGDGEQATRVEAALVSGNFFQVLGIRPAAGRLIAPADDQAPGERPVAVISFNLWRRMFNRDPGAVGNEIVVNGFPFTLIGVTAEGFSGTRMTPTDVWAPTAMHDAIKPQRAGRDPHPLDARDMTWLYVIGRLKPGLTIEQAEARMGPLYARLHADAPHYRGVRLIPVSDVKLGLTARGDAIDSMRLLTAVVGVVLLIACANVANLLMSRAQDRRRELAIRLAVGASRWRVVRQLLSESVLLALLGGGLGLILCVWVGDLLTLLVPQSRFVAQQAIDMSLDARVLLFALGISVLTGLVFGIMPAVQAVRVDPGPVLKAGAGPSGPRRRFSLQQFLVVGQVSVSLMLLVSAGLLLRSLMNIRQANPGFEPKGVLLASMDLSLHRYGEQRARRFYDRLVERVAAIPGVQSAALAHRVPIHLPYQGAMDVEGYALEEGERSFLHYNAVSPNYFATMRIPLLRGRVFEASDSSESAGVVVANQSMAGRFPGGEALGKIVRDRGKTYRIVGVVGDGRYHGLRESAEPFLYFLLSQQHYPKATLIARTLGEPMAAASAVRAAVSELDRSLPLFGVETLEDHLGADAAEEKMIATLFSALGAVAIAMVSIGLYGVMSYAVARRTREIGLRMALGAQRRDVVRLFLGRGSALIATGIVIGLAGALAVTRILQTRLYEVTATDPATFAGVTLLLVVVAMSACYLPAHRATRVDPLTALRHE
ncbi:MAG: ABC transporter permease [Planctomycetes bacterium]|nr:ABC transporter permease [Planctomycetota bacterium]